MGFPKDEATLALQITQNQKSEAVELLFSGGADLGSLQALAAVAKMEKNPQEQND